MSIATPDFAKLKSGLKASWIAGDFGQIANVTAAEAEKFVMRLGIASGARLLDVACGTGNTAIPASRAGASVTGVDIAPNLLSQARKRAAAEGLESSLMKATQKSSPTPITRSTSC
jgi:2-polyprenyl-3-methyl-5-hydroxy-6-metoxy-1,4-benzoquinol methylase